MKAATPHFLLFSESSRQDQQGRWRFVLQNVEGQGQFEAADDEPDVEGERLELLAVVRGLEALEQPSRVTLVTPSKYVNLGLTYGLEEWRANDWQWEHFGEMVPVKNRDLWQRVDHALRYHEVQCRTWRFDMPHGGSESERKPTRRAAAPGGWRARPGRARQAGVACVRRWCEEGVRGLWQSLAARGARLRPQVRFE